MADKKYNVEFTALEVPTFKKMLEICEKGFAPNDVKLLVAKFKNQLK